MKNLKEVDWDKAPEGSTHYNEDCTHPWLKETPPSYFVENKGVWREYSKSRHCEEHFNDAVKRPHEWDGSGVPPVGTVCEYRLNEYDIWFKCEIKYVLSGTNDCFVAWCDHLGTDNFLSFSSNRYKLQLRKIKTPEQLAEEEKLHAIDEMMAVGSWQSRAFKEVASALYDAGYRKTKVLK